MWRAWSWLLIVLGAWSGACSLTEQFACEADDQCMNAGIAGRCEAGGLCSFPDDDCPSGHRYGEHSGALSGECVEPDAGTSVATEDATSSGPSPETVGIDGSGSSGGTTVDPSTSGTVDPSTSGTVDPATSGTSNDSGSSTTGPEPDPYGPCVEDSDCPTPDAMCLSGAGLSACVPNCANGPCPDPLRSGNPDCSVVMEFDGCVLPCGQDIDCPAGMQCVPSPLGEVCLWT